MLSLGLRAVGRGASRGRGRGRGPAGLRGGGGGEGAGRRWSWEGANGGGPGGRSWALGRGSQKEPEVLTPLPAAPSPPGAPAEAGRGPQGVLRAHQAERHLRALLRQQQQRHPAQAPQHGGPRLRLPLRPRLHRRVLRWGRAGRPSNAVTAQAETLPAPSQLRQGGTEGPPPLPTSCQGLILPRSSAPCPGMCGSLSHPTRHR